MNTQTIAKAAPSMLEVLADFVATMKFCNETPSRIDVDHQLQLVLNKAKEALELAGADYESL